MDDWLCIAKTFSSWAALNTHNKRQLLAIIINALAWSPPRHCTECNKVHCTNFILFNMTLAMTATELYATGRAVCWGVVLALSTPEVAIDIPQQLCRIW